jgi:VWFA-related protein
MQPPIGGFGRSAALVACALAVLSLGSLRVTARQDQRPAPVFRSSVDLVAVDVQAVGRDGDPLDGLNIDDFSVYFDGHPRRVVSVDFVRKNAPPPADEGGPDRPIVTPGVLVPGTRVFVIAIDSNSFGSIAVKPAIQAAQEFVRRLHADDLVALYVYPFDRPLIALTHDHLAVGRGLDRVVGQAQPFVGQYHLTASEATDIDANDEETFRRVVSRECTGETNGGRADLTCPPMVHMEADAQAAYYESQSRVTLHGLDLLLQGLAGISGRKTVVFLSGGMVGGDRVGGRADLSAVMQEVGAKAGAADTSLYVLHMDNSFFSPFGADLGSSIDPGDRTRSAMRDEHLNGDGLDRLAGAAGGALLRVQAGSGANAFNRVLRESSAYYLLGVAPAPEDRDGKLHFLRVNVKKRGVTVRTRTHVAIPKR